MTAESKVNVDQSRDLGQKILDSMAGRNVEDYPFKKADQALTLGSKSSIKIKNESVQVDPQLLFQRLVTVGARMIYLLFSVMNCAVISLQCLNHLAFPFKPTNRPLPMPYGRCLSMNSRSPLAKCTMFWTVGHFCIVFHGLEQLLTTTYASFILIMLLNNMGDQP